MELTVVGSLCNCRTAAANANEVVATPPTNASRGEILK